MVIIHETLLIFDLILFQRRFPDLSYITQNGRLTEFLDCVIIRCVCLFLAVQLLDPLQEGCGTVLDSSGLKNFLFTAAISIWITVARFPT